MATETKKPISRKEHLQKQVNENIKKGRFWKILRHAKMFAEFMEMVWDKANKDATQDNSINDLKKEVKELRKELDALAKKVK